MNDTQPWYASRTIWMCIAGVLVPAFSGILHVTVSDAQTQELVTDLTLAGSAIAALLAWFWRVKATKAIAPKGTP